MKIICKVKDFYDYFQGIYPDNTNVFDRRDYVIIDKKDIYKWCPEQLLEFNYLILTVGYNNYAFKLTTKKTEFSKFTRTTNVVDASIELADSWKDYNTSQLFKFKLLEPYSWYRKNNMSVKELMSSGWCRVYDHDKLKIGYDRIDNRLPILSNSGLVGMLDPQEIYFAIDEYLSAQKEALETRESIGLDDTGKIINHGFDKKTSFRNVK